MTQPSAGMGRTTHASTTKVGSDWREPTPEDGVALALSLLKQVATNKFGRRSLWRAVGPAVCSTY
jgi:hypothetical protein